MLREASPRASTLQALASRCITPLPAHRRMLTGTICKMMEIKICLGRLANFTKVRAYHETIGQGQIMMVTSAAVLQNKQPRGKAKNRIECKAINTESSRGCCMKLIFTSSFKSFRIVITIWYLRSANENYKVQHIFGVLSTPWFLWPLLEAPLLQGSTQVLVFLTPVCQDGTRTYFTFQKIPHKVLSCQYHLNVPVSVLHQEDFHLKCDSLIMW